MTFSSIFDIAVALIVASFAVRGLFRGLSGEFFLFSERWEASWSHGNTGPCLQPG